MVREKTIGGIKPEIKDEFLIREIKGKFPNRNSLMERLIILFDLHNEQYEASLKKKRESKPPAK